MMVHQKEGIEWMVRHFVAGSGCILGDEMGLGELGVPAAGLTGAGKTIQSLQAVHVSRSLAHADAGKPVLAIVPLSTLQSWWGPGSLAARVTAAGCGRHRNGPQMSDR